MVNLPTEPSRSPGQHGNSNHDPVHGERSKSSLANPSHKPGHSPIGDDEGNNETDEKDNPLVAGDFVEWASIVDCGAGAEILASGRGESFDTGEGYV